jgi:DNA-binding NarL/FixJ family response regulator
MGHGESGLCGVKRVRVSTRRSLRATRLDAGVIASYVAGTSIGGGDTAVASEEIRVLTVDDHPLMREGIAAVIQGEAGIVVVGEASNGQQAIEMFRVHRPDVTLMDLQMPIMNGIEAIKAIRLEFPASRFIVLTTYQGDVQALRALKAGAMGYLLKNMIWKDLPESIRAVHAGRKRIPAEIAGALAEHVTDDALTDREVQVLRRVAMGTANKIIAAELSVSEATVKAHMKSILAKLGANDRTHAVTIAVRRGFLEG